MIICPQIKKYIYFKPQIYSLKAIFIIIYIFFSCTARDHLVYARQSEKKCYLMIGRDSYRDV